ncbi:hypothetical protein [Agrobacterium sp. CG674]
MRHVLGADMRMQVRKNRSEGSNLLGVYYAQTGAHFKKTWVDRPD